MATEFKVTNSRTYATHENAVKAAQKLYGNNSELRFFVMPTADGRFIPVFVGQSAVHAGVHFQFNVVA